MGISLNDDEQLYQQGFGGGGSFTPRLPTEQPQLQPFAGELPGFHPPPIVQPTMMGGFRGMAPQQPQSLQPLAEEYRPPIAPTQLANEPARIQPRPPTIGGFRGKAKPNSVPAQDYKPAIGGFRGKAKPQQIAKKKQAAKPKTNVPTWKEAKERVAKKKIEEAAKKKLVKKVAKDKRGAYGDELSGSKKYLDKSKYQVSPERKAQAQKVNARRDQFIRDSAAGKYDLGGNSGSAVMGRPARGQTQNPRQQYQPPNQAVMQKQQQAQQQQIFDNDLAKRQLMIKEREEDRMGYQPYDILSPEGEVSSSNYYQQVNQRPAQMIPDEVMNKLQGLSPEKLAATLQQHGATMQDYVLSGGQVG